MEKKPDNGGPAFPLDLKVGDDHRWGYGMMLRDYFAAAAMQGMLASVEQGDHDEFSDFAPAAYRMADLMMAERIK